MKPYQHHDPSTSDRGKAFPHPRTRGWNTRRGGGSIMLRKGTKRYSALQYFAGLGMPQMSPDLHSKLAGL